MDRGRDPFSLSPLELRATQDSRDQDMADDGHSRAVHQSPDSFSRDADSFSESPDSFSEAPDAETKNPESEGKGVQPPAPARPTLTKVTCSSCTAPVGLCMFQCTGCLTAFFCDRCIYVGPVNSWTRHKETCEPLK